jgi:hypothetical protein
VSGTAFQKNTGEKGSQGSKSLEHERINLFPNPLFPSSDIPRFGSGGELLQQFPHGGPRKGNDLPYIYPPYQKVLPDQGFEELRVVFQGFPNLSGKAEKEVQSRKDFGKPPTVMPPSSGLVDDANCLKGFFGGNLQVIERRDTRIQIFYSQRKAISIGVVGGYDLYCFSGLFGKPGYRQGVAVIGMKHPKIWSCLAKPVVEFLQSLGVRRYPAVCVHASVREDVRTFAQSKSLNPAICESLNFLQKIFQRAFPVGVSPPFGTKTAVFLLPATPLGKLKLRNNPRVLWMLYNQGSSRHRPGSEIFIVFPGFRIYSIFPKVRS